MQQTHNTLSENIRAKSIELLNKHLAATIDLRGQVEQAHWNVRGPTFIALRQLFDEVADTIDDYSDSLAEREAALGGIAYGTVQVAAQRSLVPYALGIGDEYQYVFAVSSSLSAFGQSARQGIDDAAAYGDPGTADLFTELSRGIDHQLWVVEAHLPGK